MGRECSNDECIAPDAACPWSNSSEEDEDSNEDQVNFGGQQDEPESDYTQEENVSDGDDTDEDSDDTNEDLSLIHI